MEPNERFRLDMETIYNRVSSGLSGDGAENLRKIIERLVELNTRRLVKINHSVMEVVAAAYLISDGWEVEVEKPVGRDLVCDLYAVRDGETLIIEVETGYVPPENALDPISYWDARVVGKAARYSHYASQFKFAIPPYHILRIPTLYEKPLRERAVEEAVEIKKLCDRYYRHPPITLDEILNAKLNGVLMVNVDKGRVEEISINVYLKLKQIDYLYF